MTIFTCTKTSGEGVHCVCILPYVTPETTFDPSSTCSTTWCNISARCPGAQAESSPATHTEAPEFERPQLLALASEKQQKHSITHSESTQVNWDLPRHTYGEVKVRCLQAHSELEAIPLRVHPAGVMFIYTRATKQVTFKTSIWTRHCIKFLPIMQPHLVSQKFAYKTSHPPTHRNQYKNTTLVLLGECMKTKYHNIRRNLWVSHTNLCVVVQNASHHWWITTTTLYCLNYLFEVRKSSPAPVSV